MKVHINGRARWDEEEMAAAVTCVVQSPAGDDRFGRVGQREPVSYSYRGVT